MAETPPSAPTPPEGPSAHEARLEAVLEAASDAFYAVDSDWRMVVYNRAAERYFRLPRGDVLGQSLWELFPQGKGGRYERYCRRAMDERLASTYEAASILRPDRFVEVRVMPMRDGGVAVSLTDITDRRKAEDVLRAARDRSEEILESISDAFYAMDADWRFTYVNRVAETWWGRPRDDLIGKCCWEEFPHLMNSPVHEAHLRALRERQVVRLENASPRTGRWIEQSIFPSENGVSVYFRDIGARKEAERRQRLLVNELNHRVKNTLAVVQALARQTFAAGRPADAAQEDFTARLSALAAAHDVITEQDWTGADLAEIVGRTVASQLDRPDRLVVDGCPAQLPPKMALSLSLAFHELVTNAYKYGALSTDDGRIALAWRVEGPSGEQRLRLTWREEGGPPVSRPATKGFGSRLIERALAADLAGKVALSFEAAGVVCRIDAPLEPATSVFDAGLP